MEYVNLGKSGLSVSRICLGMMSFGTPEWRDYILTEEESRPIIERALELGINFFDTADMYSAGASEKLTGKFLREFTRRDEVVIATKVFFPVDLAFQGGFADSAPQRPNTNGLSRKHIFAAAEASLKRLGVDYIDLYQLHWPNRDHYHFRRSWHYWTAGTRLPPSIPSRTGRRGAARSWQHRRPRNWRKNMRFQYSSRRNCVSHRW